MRVLTSINAQCVNVCVRRSCVCVFAAVYARSHWRIINDIVAV